MRIVVRFAIFAMIFSSFSPTVFGQKKIKCGSETVIVPKHPDKAYKQYAKTTDVKLKATIDIASKVKIGDLDLGTQQQFKELRDKLDNYHAIIETIVKAAVMAYCTTPCDKDVRKRYFDLLDNLNKENTALESLKSQLEKITTSGKIGGTDANQVKSAISKYNSENGEKAFAK